MLLQENNSNEKPKLNCQLPKATQTHCQRTRASVSPLSMTTEEEQRSAKA